MLVMRPLFVFAHGAGIPSRHPWMERWAARLLDDGDVVRFDYDYVAAGRKAPDPEKRLLARHRRAIDEAVAAHGGPLVLIGKSMGSRIGCMVSPEREDVRAVVCFGYPLRSPSGELRRAPLANLRVPALLVQGTKDTLAPLDALDEVISGLPKRPRVYVVDGGDHSLDVGTTALKASGRTQDAVDAAIHKAIRGFLREALG
jgi:predicted alpha/beta-hydrolase family hydrolase